MDTTFTSKVARGERRVTTPRAGAIAGILFSITFALSVTLMASSLPGAVEEGRSWLDEGAGLFSFALRLIPFSGIFFLWFIAVTRERLGRFEDQFFSTVFLGSGLLFLAAIMAAAGVAGALVVSYSRAPDEFGGSTTYMYSRDVVLQIFNVYALRMAGVFLISQATLWLRTGVMPRWMAFLTYAVALLLLLVVTQALWVFLVFPAWVLAVSLYIFVLSFRPPEPDAADGMTPDPHLQPTREAS